MDIRPAMEDVDQIVCMAERKPDVRMSGFRFTIPKLSADLQKTGGAMSEIP